MLQNKTYPNLSLLLREQVKKEELILSIPIIFTLIISAIRLPGNVFVWYVYGIKSTTSSRWFFSFLGGTNFVQCLIVVPGEIIYIFLQYNFKYGLCKATRFLNCSSLVVMLFTLVTRKSALRGTYTPGWWSPSPPSPSHNHPAHVHP